MKTFRFLFLSMLAMVWLGACSESDEPMMQDPDVETEKVDSLSLDGYVVEANTNFTEADLIKALQGSVWYNNPEFPYIYDGGITKRIDFGVGCYNSPDPEQYKFSDAGDLIILADGMNRKPYTAEVSYKVKNNVIRFDYISTTGKKGVEEVEVISLTKDVIIFDRKYCEGYIYEKYMNYNNWFNPKTAKLRYVWKIHQYIPDGSIVLPDGTVVNPDGSIVLPDGTIVNP